MQRVPFQPKRFMQIFQESRVSVLMRNLLSEVQICESPEGNEAICGELDLGLAVSQLQILRTESLN